MGAKERCHKFVPVVPESSVMAPAMNKTDVMSCKVCTQCTKNVSLSDFTQPHLAAATYVFFRGSLDPSSQGNAVIIHHFKTAFNTVFDTVLPHARCLIALYLAVILAIQVADCIRGSLLCCHRREIVVKKSIHAGHT